jgi:pimeloyl-ACP methyl ester carboxylesterase
MSDQQSTVHTVPVHDGHLAYTDTGRGPVVVLLHGGTLDHRMWDRQVPVLAGTHRVLAVDARGHGRSSTPTTPFRHTDDLAVLLAHLEVGRAVLVGVSMGAATAVDTAVDHPDLVSAVVVTGAGTSDPDFRDPWQLDRLRQWQQAAERQDEKRWSDIFLGFAVGPRRSPADLDPQVLADLRQMAQDTLDNHVHGTPPLAPDPVEGIRERARHLSVPVLAILGGLDSDDHIRMPRELADAVPHGRSVVIDHAAHYPNMECPAEYNALLATFLGTVR